jgi:hypothetical protein
MTDPLISEIVVDRFLGFGIVVNMVEGVFQNRHYEVKFFKSNAIFDFTEYEVKRKLLKHKDLTNYEKWSMMPLHDR